MAKENKVVIPGRRLNGVSSIVFVAVFASSVVLMFGKAAVPVVQGTAPKNPPSPSEPPHSRLVYPGKDGRLVYTVYDAQGDTLPDFSHCGYGGGGIPLPIAPVRVTLSPIPGDSDDLPRTQAAIDTVSKLPLGKDGLRGAVLLKQGRYRLSGTLHITESGVVLRGEGTQSDKGTVLFSTARTAKPIISVGGDEKARLTPQTERGPLRIADAYVPVGARTLRVSEPNKLHVGDTVLIWREGNAAWIHEIGMDAITPRKADPTSTKQWSPFTLDFDRIIVSIQGSTITLDAPLTCAIDARWGGGTVIPCRDRRVEKVGVENLYAETVYDPAKMSDLNDSRHTGKMYLADEDHANYLVAFGNVRNAWASRLSVRFLQGVAQIGRGSKWVTVQDGASVDPVSIITGGRRYTYNVGGQLCLVQRCYARDARHAFVIGDSHVAGPNVFLDCRADDSHNTSEPHQRWSVGGLYDNVNAPMAFQDRQWMGSGHGWAGANYVVWNSQGRLVCQQPPTAQNFAIGFVGKREPGAFPRPAGWWESEGTPVTPRSLYRKQLEDRLGTTAVTRANIGSNL